MRKIEEIYFESEEQFLNELDGKVFAVANPLGTKFLGELLQDDFVKLWDEGYLLSYDWDSDEKINAHEQKYVGQKQGNASCIVLTDDKHFNKVRNHFVQIIIKNK